MVIQKQSTETQQPSQGLDERVSPAVNQIYDCVRLLSSHLLIICLVHTCKLRSLVVFPQKTMLLTQIDLAWIPCRCVWSFLRVAFTSALLRDGCCFVIMCQLYTDKIILCQKNCWEELRWVTFPNIRNTSEVKDWTQITPTPVQWRL